ncbi:glycoside hydrolase family 25 protein [Nocardioides sp. HB32]
MPRTPEQAIAAARNQSQHGPKFGVGECKMRCRDAYNVPSDGSPSAADAWSRARHKHAVTNVKDIPRGALIWWTGGSHGWGHVAISAGDGKCWSTDIGRSGYFDLVDLDLIHTKWGLTLVGWSEDIDGVRALTVPTKPPTRVATKSIIDGIDISHWQSGTINFGLARQDGVKFVFHKATEGKTYVDPKYAQRRAEVKRAGISFGAYHFARPGASDGVTQARHFLATAKPAPGDMQPVLDLEDRGGKDQATLTAWTVAFAAEVKRQLGVDIILYTNFDLGPAVAKYPLWVARYNNAMEPPRIPAPWKSWSIWQFSNGQYGNPKSVDGVGPCDINTLCNGVQLATLRIPGKHVTMPAKTPRVTEALAAVARADKALLTASKYGATQDVRKTAAAALPKLRDVGAALGKVEVK